ncbi:hypothetical protein ACLB2K_067418 [Fragaria x ananassa]
MNQVGQLGNEGFCYWKNLNRCLSSHETSKHHIGCMTQWIELEKRIEKNKTIDKSVQVAINKEREHWKQVLKRIIAIIQRMAKNNLALRGDCEKLFVDNNGIFLQVIEMVAEFDLVMQEHLNRIPQRKVIEMVAEFDLVMQEHLNRIQQRKVHYSYLGTKIQNELIVMLAADVKSSILAKVKNAKYFVVIPGCTPDASHEEQISLFIRCVDHSENIVAVEEFWLEFLKVHHTKGLGLFKELQIVLSKLDLDIDDIRGQGYNNGYNMKGRHRGVQRRLLEVNPRAFYTPCGCHSLNLALCDMVTCCSKAMSFFGVVQHIYTLFSSSTKRWYHY